MPISASTPPALFACIAAVSIGAGQLAPVSAVEEIRIEVPIFEGGAGLDFFFLAAREYEKERPGVEVDLYGDPRIRDKVRVRILEGTFPDVVKADLDHWTLIYNGDYLALDEYLDGPSWEGGSTWRESFLTGSLDLYGHEGKVYGVPLLYSVNVTWYDKNLFAERGWKPAKTWNEFLALCEQIKATGLWPLAFQGRYPSYASSMIDNAFYHLAGRERFFGQKRLRAGSFDNPEAIRALGMMQHVAQNYFQPGAMGMSHTEAQLEFFLGHTAMIFCGSWLKSEMMGKIPDGFRLGSFNLPLVAESIEDPHAINTSAGYFHVMSRGQHPEVGADFLRFMTSRRMAGTFAEMRDVPVAVRGAMKGRLSEDMQDLIEIVESATTTFGAAPGESFPEMDQALNDVRHKLITGTVTPEEAARQLEAAAAAIRNQASNPDSVTVQHVWKPVLLIGLLAGAALFWVYQTIRRLRDKTGAQTSTGSRVRMRWQYVALFLGPSVLLYTLFVVIPSVKSFAWSVNRWNGLSADMSFVGLLHFKRLLLESDAFWIALKNNLFIMFVIPLFVLPLALFLAVCISRGVRGSQAFRIVFFFPNLLGGVAATLLWMHLYNPQGGLVNGVLTGLGLSGFEGFAWLAQNNLYWALVPMSVWAACGFNMVLFLAAMESIPQSIYEAAGIDGASEWRQFWTLTLPLIWEIVSIAVVFMIIGGMKAFEVIWLLTNQVPVTDTHVIGTRMVQTMFKEFHVGEATAVAVLLFLMVFFGTTVAMRVMRRETVEF